MYGKTTRGETAPNSDKESPGNNIASRRIVRTTDRAVRQAVRRPAWRETKPKFPMSAMQFPLPRSATRRPHSSACLSFVLLTLGTAGAWADSCPSQRDEIATDRPDLTNSSLVVPVGSFQSENGINFSARDGGRILDGTNTRWRLGIAPCLELLVDLPTYVSKLRAPGSSGFLDVAPAVKWQISPVPGKIDLSVVAGVALPTGTADVAGRGTQPYLQSPWSWELNDGWGLSGMLTEFFRPAEPTMKRVTETSFAVEKKLTETFSIFAEYVGDYPEHAGPSQLINSGGLYRLGRTQQLDFHVAFGLNHNSPAYVIGVGYSFRLDGLFR
ncbi:transporter [Bradyrhizobium sp.]|uniref:transporter n=1 Tax=Bradyrhizobium sp. TaxID=376 RepID=UPI0025B83D48|nr:transporter [Bradyrhizobium sp.]